MSYETSKNTDKIVQTALELFKQEGYENVSVRQICGAAGIPRSSFYSIFSGKKEIMGYMLKKVRKDIQDMLPAFIKAANDFERIWILSDRFLQLAQDYGPNLTKAIFRLELEESCGLFELLDGFNDWLIPLLANCQESRIVGNKEQPEKLIPMQINLAKAVLFDWCRMNGSFPLQERVRENIEIFLDLQPEYRWK